MNFPGKYPTSLNPWAHAAGAVVMMLPMQLLMSLFISDQGMVDAKAPYVVVLAMQLIFTMANSIATFSVEDVYPHAATSVYAFLAMSLMGYAVAYLTTSSLPSSANGLRLLLSMGWIGFICLKSIAMTIKMLVQFIKEKDKEFLDHE